MLRTYGGRDNRHSGSETVPLTIDCRDISGSVGGVAQVIAQLLDRNRQAIVKVAERDAGPQSIAQRLPCDSLAACFEERDEHLKRLVGETNPAPVLAELPTRHID